MLTLATDRYQYQGQGCISSNENHVSIQIVLLPCMHWHVCINLNLAGQTETLHKSRSGRDLIAESIYNKYSVGPSIKSICTTCCFTMTNMNQARSNLH